MKNICVQLLLKIIKDFLEKPPVTMISMIINMGSQRPKIGCDWLWPSLICSTGSSRNEFCRGKYLVLLWLLQSSKILVWVKSGRDGRKFIISKCINTVNIVKSFSIKNFIPASIFYWLTIFFFYKGKPFLDDWPQGREIERSHQQLLGIKKYNQKMW